MALVVPNPTVPTNGQALDASPLLANLNAVYQAIQAFDASQIVAGTLAAAAFNASINPNTLLKETTSPFVQTGLVWSIVSGLNGTMTSGIQYYNGIRVSVNSVASQAFTASKDTYIDIDVNGNITYSAVANGAASPALTANSNRVALVITSGAAITTIIQSGFDTLGNKIYYSGSIQGANAAGMWYEELGRSTLTVAGNTMSIPVITAKKYLRILISAIPSGSIQTIMRFNNDSGANYARRDNTNGGADGTGGSTTEMLIPNVGANNQIVIWDVTNVAAQEKYAIAKGSSGVAGAASIPNRHEIVNKWANTAAQITRVDVLNISGGAFAIGSEVVVLGHN